ncbi:MAG: thiopurine S-methyltransferase [Rhodobacteraceae bacterium CG17_big_fil_post_rev_8_21_14_2_50_63_15]|nr:thiopurine S-methyltransferase [Roseovarius sp.]PIV78363.1 MAG: thiopurine S-methyltransferase [Rhodobacteraceae bacterium CG17_big_fil_post_rev_8_21_14_2_50_63_15]
MEAEFWHSRWEKMQIGFHEGAVNRMLATHLAALGLARGARIFLPLCGKTRDIAWLLAQEYRVAGAELSEIAVRQLFEEMDVTPEVTQTGPLRRYAALGIDVFVGDIFDLTTGLLGAVDAVYDRAALVALPEAMRGRYAAHLAAITAHAPQLLITFEYDPSVMNGPPFSLSNADVETCHGGRYDITVLAEAEVPGGLKGFCPAQERALLLRPKALAGRETSLNTA